MLILFPKFVTVASAKKRSISNLSSVILAEMEWNQESTDHCWNILIFKAFGNGLKKFLHGFSTKINDRKNTGNVPNFLQYTLLIQSWKENLSSNFPGLFLWYSTYFTPKYYFYSLWKIRKLLVFWHFQGYGKETHY